MLFLRWKNSEEVALKYIVYKRTMQVTIVAIGILYMCTPEMKLLKTILNFYTVLFLNYAGCS